MKIVFIFFLMMKIDTLKKTIELNIYLVLASKQKNKEALKNYTKLWEETKQQIELINDDEPIEYREDFIKIRIESDDDS